MGIPYRSVFFISDGTAITAETLGRSILSQFSGINFEPRVIPYVDSPERAQNAIEQINAATLADGCLLYTSDAADE